MYKSIFSILIIMLLIATPIYASNWIAVNYSNPDLIEEAGITIEEFNNLTQSEWLELLGDKEKVNFAFKATDPDGNDITNNINPNLSINVSGLDKTETVIFEPITETEKETETTEDTQFAVRDTEIKLNSTSLQYNKIIHVNGENGDDINGDGTSDKPLKTISKALKEINGDNQAIYINEGAYNVKLTHRPTSYNEREYSLFSTAVNYDYDVIGNPINPPVLYNNSTDNFQSFFVTLKTSEANKALNINFYNIIFKGLKLFSDISNDYNHNVIFNNCVYESSLSNKNGFYFNVGIYNTSDYNIEFNNSLFIGDYLNYTNRDDSVLNATNSVFYYKDKDKYKYSPELKFNSSKINPLDSYNSDYSLKGDFWKNAGTGENPDGTQANLGVYGGKFAW